MEPWNIETLNNIKNPPVPGWPAVQGFMMRRFGKVADLKSILFVVGLRELGARKESYTKEEKQDVMNLAFCSVLALGGYFEISHLDAAGWPHFRQIKPLPPMDVNVQERFIREHIVRYFADNGLVKFREGNSPAGPSKGNVAN